MAEKIRELAKDGRTVRRIKTAVFVIFLVVVLFTVFYLVRNLIPTLIQLLKDGEVDEISDFLRSQGKIGMVILIALQVLQTITIVFPGIPIYVAAGLVYGKFWGTVVCYLTYVISNAAVFLFARKMGGISEQILSSRKKKDSEEYATSLLQRTKYPGYITAALCVIPIVPNGLVPYIAAKTQITFKNFLLAIMVGCFPGILLFIWCGSLILDGHIGTLIVICLIALACFILFMVFKKKLMRFVNEKILSRFINSGSAENNIKEVRPETTYETVDAGSDVKAEDIAS